MNKKNKRKESIKDFIGIYDGYLDATLCKKVIDIYKQQENFKKTLRRNIYHNQKKSNIDDSSAFIDYKNIDSFTVGQLDFININFRQALDHYINTTGILDYLGTNELDFNDIKIQKTSPTQGYHIWHIERGYNHFSLGRVLAYTIYLNDDFEGGETEFLFQKTRVAPKTGRIAIWPAAFPYVHRGNPPLDKDKYIVTSWLLTKITN